MQTAGVQGINIPYNTHTHTHTHTLTHKGPDSHPPHLTPDHWNQSTLQSGCFGPAYWSDFTHTHTGLVCVCVCVSDSFTAQLYWLATPQRPRENREITTREECSTNDRSGDKDSPELDGMKSWADRRRAKPWNIKENTRVKMFDTPGCQPVSRVSLSLSPSQSVLFLFWPLTSVVFNLVAKRGVTTHRCKQFPLSLSLFWLLPLWRFLSLTLSGTASLSLHPFPFILCCSASDASFQNAFASCANLLLFSTKLSCSTSLSHSLLSCPPSSLSLSLSRSLS